MDVAFKTATDRAAWSPRHGHSVVRFEDRFWLFGGCQAEGTDPSDILGDVWSSADGAGWQREADTTPWPDRYLHEMVVYDGRLWMFGGMHRYRPDRVNLNDVWCSDDGVTWEERTTAAPWPTRHVFASVVHDGRMWVSSGAPDGMIYYNDVWWSTDGNQWHECPGDGTRFCVRKNPALVSYRDKLWMIGGMELVEPAVARALNDVWCSDNGSRWSQVTARAPWSPRDFPTVVVYRDKLWLIDGREESSDQHVPELWWSADGESWQRHSAQLPWSGRHCAAPLVHDDAVWFFGGAASGPPEGHFNDVWQLHVVGG